jgi:hypothetical protein
MRTYTFQYDVTIARPGGQDETKTYHGVKVEAESYAEARSKAVDYISDQWSHKDLITAIKPDTQTE